MDQAGATLRQAAAIIGSVAVELGKFPIDDDTRNELLVTTWETMMAALFTGSNQ